MAVDVVEGRRKDVRCRLGRIFGICFTLTLTGFCYGTYIFRFVVPLFSEGSTAAGMVCVCLMSVCYLGLVVSLLRAAMTHPGGVPSFFDVASMNHLTESAFVDICASLDLPSDVSDEMRTRLRVGSTSVCLVSSLRFCDTCELYKCQTTHHCSACGVCVFEMDHHCPWIGGCIGRGNHKYFLLFLFYTVVSGALLVASCAHAVLGNSGIKETLLFCAWIIALAFVLILTPFLVSAAQTVHQNTSTIAKMQLRRSVGQLSRASRRSRPVLAVPHSYAAIRGVEEGDVGLSSASAVPTPTEESPAPRGLQRIMGSGRKFPWWLLPLSPVLQDDEDRWTLEIRQEVEDQIDFHMSTLVQLHARRQHGQQVL